ncbi:MAG: ABC transporter permease, partial [Alphaproteobacteria bacterium]|nr:ABC transporter permease [Alphaproteobacteria bacterium]
RQWLPLATLIILVTVVGVMEPVFLEPSTLLQLASDTAVLFILATGVTFVIMLGGIDLSLQSMASFSSVIVALTIAQLGYVSFGLAVGTGILAGFLSGIAHVKLKIPSFIATLAMGGVLFSAALVASKERSITLGDAERSYQTWVTGSHFGIPNVIVVGLIVLIVAHVLQAHTRFGRYSAAIGAGEPAAYASGVKVDRQKIFAYMLSAGFAALAGVILAGRLSSGSPTLAAEMLLPSIAAVVVGGTAITGGVGSIWRTLVGSLIISVVRIGMTFLSVNIFAQNIVFGSVLVLAVAVTIDRSKIPIVK